MLPGFFCSIRCRATICAVKNVPRTFGRGLVNPTLTQAWSIASHIDLLDASEFIPRLVDEGLVNGNASGRHTSIDCLENIQRFLKCSLQAILLRDIRLDIQCLAAESRAPRIKFLWVNRFFLNVPDGDVAAHFTDGSGNRETDSLCAAGDDVVAAGELESRADTVR